MQDKEEEDKIAFMTCVELVLMKKGNTIHNLVMAKLKSLYDADIMDCFEHPEYLRTVLKQVFKDEYAAVLNEVKLELEKLVDIDRLKTKFFRVMED